MALGRVLVASGGALLVSLCLVTVPDVGPAVASTSQTGIVDCRGLAGIIRFDPPLKNNGTSAEVAELKMTVHGCKASGGGTTPHVGRAIVALSPATNNCSDLTSGEIGGATVVIRWTPTKIGETSVDFPGFTPLTGGEVGFSAGGVGTTVSGSYAGADAGASSTATVVSQLSTAQLADACRSARGLRSLKIRRGTLDLA